MPYQTSVIIFKKGTAQNAFWGIHAEPDTGSFMDVTKWHFDFFFKRYWMVSNIGTSCSVRRDVALRVNFSYS